jgi:hypothetical protein
MVQLVDEPSEFHARVIVAKLGSAGILAEVRGLSGPYPNLTQAQVWVDAEELADARELLGSGLDDEFAVLPDDERSSMQAWRYGRHGLIRPILVAMALLLLGSFAVGLRCSATPTVQSR